MDKLKEEIARKKRLLLENQLISSERKHFKREELIKLEEKEYYEKSNLKVLNEQINENKTEKNEKSNKTTKDEIIFPRKEVIRRLRDRNEPILLFGESEHDAFLRLKHLELINPDLTKGQVNDFQQALERVDEYFINEMLKMDNHENESVRKKMHDVKIEEINLTEEQLKNMAKELGRKKEQKEVDSKIIVQFLKYILEIWGKSLNARPDDVKSKTSGRISAAMYTQTTNYLKPLFKQLTKNKIADDILKHLTNICKFMIERDYVQANSAYLEMAIGNSPWPIGVTMVGIHARTGREKIFAQNIAHVLNDETQRKYIQGLKRLISQCQSHFPTVPSKCVEYVKKEEYSDL